MDSSTRDQLDRDSAARREGSQRTADYGNYRSGSGGARGALAATEAVAVAVAAGGRRAGRRRQKALDERVGPHEQQRPASTFQGAARRRESTFLGVGAPKPLHDR